MTKMNILNGLCSLVLTSTLLNFAGYHFIEVVFQLFLLKINPPPPKFGISYKKIGIWKLIWGFPVLHELGIWNLLDNF